MEANAALTSKLARKLGAVRGLCAVLTFFVLNISTVYASNLYWTSQTTGKIERANLDGTQRQDVITGLTGNYGLAIDEVHSRVYWSDINSGTISRANLDGTGRHTILAGLADPLTLRLDLANDRLFWKENSGIYRATLAGAGKTKLLTTSGEGQGLAIDFAQSRMYFSSYPEGQIQRANLDGTGLVNLVTRPGTEGVELDSIHSQL